MDDLEVAGERRRLLEEMLPQGWFHGTVGSVADRLGCGSIPDRWERTPDSEGSNNRRNVSYRIKVPGVDGRTAVAAWARLQLPAGMQFQLLSTVDFRVDFSALPDDVQKDDSSLVSSVRRLSADELGEMFIVAWMLATRSLPLAVTNDLLRMRPAGPTRVELHIDSERPPNLGHDRVLGLMDMIDFTEFGEAPSLLPPSMSTSITTPLVISDHQVEDSVMESLFYMTSSFGFINYK
ncbi:hypothetical protein ABT352_01555 [Streptosporangium sp. NPDC000563]|uniref:hypothetical protein n=1 Tax=Streptosporangium sp. NPDC000563 TaxID=3154366 RepID=UPI00331E0985